MKYRKYGISLLTGLLLSFMLMWYRGFLSAQNPADRVLIVCDSMTILAFLYLGTGALLWVSATGCLDIFGYAFKKCVHVLLPGRLHDTAGNYYEYKVKKSEGQKAHRERYALGTGLFFLLCSFILAAVWYMIS